MITAGNHSFRRREVYEFFDREELLLVPLISLWKAPGHGSCIVDKGRLQIGVINLMGVVYLESLDCPFAVADQLLKKMPAITLVDFHAEATGEKGALAYYFGRSGICYFWHSHPCANSGSKFLIAKRGGIGFITDIGMTGPTHSVWE